MEDKLKTTLAGEPVELFMSYNLLRRLVAIVGEMSSDVGSIYISPEVQERALTEVLKRHYKKPELDLDDVDLTREEAEGIIKWVGEHTLDFFMRGLETSAKASSQMAERTNALMPSSDGTPSSP